MKARPKAWDDRIRRSTQFTAYLASNYTVDKALYILYAHVGCGALLFFDIGQIQLQRAAAVWSRVCLDGGSFSLPRTRLKLTFVSGPPNKKLIYLGLLLVCQSATPLG